MARLADHLLAVSKIVREIRKIGFEPVLVGGMAMVVLGSRRVTRDFDFVLAHPGDRLESLVEAFYRNGLELVSRLDEDGNVSETIDNCRVAALRIQIDRPMSVYFYRAATMLRVDLLFDFPVPAADLVIRATRLKIRGQSLLVASEEDLLRLKKVAAAARSVPGDADDIAFLEARKK